MHTLCPGDAVAYLVVRHYTVREFHIRQRFTSIPQRRLLRTTIHRTPCLDGARAGGHLQTSYVGPDRSHHLVHYSWLGLGDSCPADSTRLILNGGRRQVLLKGTVPACCSGFALSMKTASCIRDSCGFTHPAYAWFQRFIQP